MMKRSAFFVLAVALALTAGHGFPSPAPESTDRGAALDFDKAEYAARRQTLMARIPEAIAIIQGSLAGPRNNKFIQNNEFVYLCGVKLPKAVLIVDGIHKESILFLTTTENYLKNEGFSLGFIRDPQGTTGIDKVHPVKDLLPVLSGLAAKAKAIYTPYTPEGPPQEVASDSPLDGRATREFQLVAMLQRHFPDVEVRDCTPILWDMRRIKRPAEIEMLREASRITVEAMIEVMKAARVGQGEHELSALFEYGCKRRGASGVFDYDVIISSAENHPYLHYSRHDRTLVDGDFLVFDSGADYRDYDSDLTISFPINGVFSPRQKEIYDACLAVSEACLEFYRPGVTAYEVGEAVRNKLQSEGYDLTGDAFTRLRYFKEGGVTHYVGLATHDAGGSDKPKDQPLKVGEVFASDVFAVFPGENLGVRVENIVLITETGCENLSPGLPRKIPEIEALMKSGIPDSDGRANQK